jgi:hypothetical protein
VLFFFDSKLYTGCLFAELGVYYSRAAFCFMLFCGQKGSTQRIFTKKCFLFRVGSLLSRKAVHTWVEKFSQGSSKVADDARPCRFVEIATEATVQWFERLILADRRITIYIVATILGCFQGLTYSIMHGRLKFRKVCEWWVPRGLKYREKMNRMCLSLQHLLPYADEGEDILNKTVTGCITNNLNRSVLPCNGNIPAHFQSNNKVMISASKVMLTVFWERGENVNSATYCEVLLRLKDAARFIMTMPDPIQPEQPGENQRTTVGTS